MLPKEAIKRLENYDIDAEVIKVAVVALSTFEEQMNSATAIIEQLKTNVMVWECPRCHTKMQQWKYPKFSLHSIDCEIPLKLPSLNEYINACRKNAYAGAKMKKQTQEDIMWFVKKLPKFDKPISIHFHWVEGNRKRDYDNIASAKKFILDAMVKCGKLKDDNRNFVTGFSDTFGYEKGTWKVILEIEEGE